MSIAFFFRAHTARLVAAIRSYVHGNGDAAVVVVGGPAAGQGVAPLTGVWTQVVVAGAQKHPHQKPASCRRAPSRLHPGVVRSLLALQLLYAAMFGSHLQFLLLDLARLVACRTTSAVDEGRARGSTRLGLIWFCSALVNSDTLTVNYGVK